VTAPPPAVATPADAESLDATVARLNAALPAATPRADGLAILRRLHLALVGTIPSLEEIRRFESLPAHERIQRWTDQLLADRRWADHTAERLARAWVGVEDGPFLVFRRRRLVTWLADELAAGKSYDQLVRALVTAEGLWTDQPAANFLTVTSVPPRQDPDESRLAARVARGFLGVRLDCAECHDHPFEPWKQRDFRALAAFFLDTTQTLSGVRDQRQRREASLPTWHADVEPAVPFSAELLPAEGPPRTRLAQWITDTQNRPFATAYANRVWALLYGRALIEPVDQVPQNALPAALSTLADDAQAHRFDLRRSLRAIARSDLFQCQSLEAPSESPEDPDSPSPDWTHFPLVRLRPEQLALSLMQASSLWTIDAQSHLLLRFAQQIERDKFVKRYGPLGEEEFRDPGGTIPQRLVLMNGPFVQARSNVRDPGTATFRIAKLAPSAAQAVETAFLVALTRRPTPPEREHFQHRLTALKNSHYDARLEDLAWALFNSTEFAWNH